MHTEPAIILLAYDVVLEAEFNTHKVILGAGGVKVKEEWISSNKKKKKVTAEDMQRFAKARNATP